MYHNPKKPGKLFKTKKEALEVVEPKTEPQVPVNTAKKISKEAKDDSK